MKTILWLLISTVFINPHRVFSAPLSLSLVPPSVLRPTSRSLAHPVPAHPAHIRPPMPTAHHPNIFLGPMTPLIPLTQVISVVLVVPLIPLIPLWSHWSHWSHDPTDPIGPMVVGTGIRSELNWIESVHWFLGSFLGSLVPWILSWFLPWVLPWVLGSILGSLVPCILPWFLPCGSLVASLVPWLLGIELYWSEM